MMAQLIVSFVGYGLALVWLALTAVCMLRYASGPVGRPVYLIASGMSLGATLVCVWTTHFIIKIVLQEAQTPSFGTAFIGFWGYGFAILMGTGTLVALRDYYRAVKRGDGVARIEELTTFMVGVVITIAATAVTRWLIG